MAIVVVGIVLLLLEVFRQHLFLDFDGIIFCQIIRVTESKLFAHLEDFIAGQGILIFNLEAKHGVVVQCFLDGVLVQARAEKPLCRTSQIAFTGTLILIEDRRTRKAVPKGIREEFLQVALRLRRNRTMAFIYDKGNAETAQALCLRTVFLFFARIPLDDNLQLLDRRDDNHTVFVVELLHQFAGIIRIIHVDDVILGIRLERE